MESRSWLIGGESDRERLLDMDRRLRPARRYALAVLAASLLASGPWLGWWTLAPLLITMGIFRGAEKRIEGAARPEYPMFAAWAGSEAVIAASLALMGDSAVSMLFILSIPIVTLSARFPLHGVLTGVATALGVMFAVAFATDSQAVIADPPLLIVPAAAVIAIAMLSTALMRSDREHRKKAVLDQLTGLLNRGALEVRADELAQQSELSGEPVAVIVTDLDGFKGINDLHGHAGGDAVLKEIAYLLRKRLRAFDLAYRLGGDEFLFLVPGADLGAAEPVACSLQEILRSERPGGAPQVSMSCGLSASRRGEAFDFWAVFGEADAALYEAKRRGGDLVVRGAAPRQLAARGGNRADVQPQTQRGDVQSGHRLTIGCDDY